MNNNVKKGIATIAVMGAIALGASLTPSEKSHDQKKNDEITAYDKLGADKSKLSPQDRAVIDSIINDHIVPDTLTVEQIDRITPFLTDPMWKKRFEIMRKSLQ